MKRLLSLLLLTAVFLSLGAAFFPCSAAESDDVESVEPTYEELRQRNLWIYILLACVSTAGVITAAVLITKKKE